MPFVSFHCLSGSNLKERQQFEGTVELTSMPPVSPFLLTTASVRKHRLVICQIMDLQDNFFNHLHRFFSTSLSTFIFKSSSSDIFLLEGRISCTGLHFGNTTFFFFLIPTPNSKEGKFVSDSL